MKLVLASHNAAKLAELKTVLLPLVPNIELSAYSGPAAVEDGSSFAENALIKARAAAKYTGLPALADDSGLAVAALGGCPGIFSARWAGSNSSDAANRQLLLEQLVDLPASKRAAEFVCAAALVLPSGVEHCELGTWAGELLRAPIGEYGFGYDPIFQPLGGADSAAQMLPSQKNQVSHRAQAFRALAPHIVAAANRS